MDGIIGRLQTEADSDGKRTDIHLATSVNAIKMEDGSSLADIVSNMGISATMSEDVPSHSSLWILPVDY